MICRSLSNGNDDQKLPRGQLVPVWPGRAAHWGWAPEVTAGVRENDPEDDNFRVSEGAAAAEGPAAAERCEAARRNCCKLLRR